MSQRNLVALQCQCKEQVNVLMIQIMESIRSCKAAIKHIQYKVILFYHRCNLFALLIQVYFEKTEDIMS